MSKYIHLQDGNLGDAVVVTICKYTEYSEGIYVCIEDSYCECGGSAITLSRDDSRRLMIWLQEVLDD